MGPCDDVKTRLAFWKDALAEMRKAYIALLEGGVQSYTINDRTLRKHDLPNLMKDIIKAEKMVDELCALLHGKSRRRAFGVVPRDW